MESRLSHLRYFSKIVDSPLPSVCKVRRFLLRTKNFGCAFGCLLLNLFSPAYNL